jgi:radical SAM/Cys-rich protein
MSVVSGDFAATVSEAGLSVAPVSIDTLWVNITRRCNQACAHCHVGASPDRTEAMGRAGIERCLEVIGGLPSCRTLDITGGAPELHPDFDYLVAEAAGMGKNVTVRHNLTVTIDGDPRSGAGKDYLPRFFAENRVDVLASLPHYTEAATDAVRGPGVFRKSLESLRRLNAAGYGLPGTGLRLDLVYNRDGPVSARERADIEGEFRGALAARYGLSFSSLLAVTNMPVGRYRARLRESAGLEGYIDSLENSFCPEAAASLACRRLVSVGWDGRLYDCDFNQMLRLGVAPPAPDSIFSFDLPALLARRIRFGPHCFGCTAGGGGS